MKRICLALAPLLALAACATLSEDQCRQGDWYRIGRADGADGRLPEFIAQHRKACDRYGITPDTRAWLQGRQEGLPLYCTPRRAFGEGAGGKHLSPVCPPEELAELERANARGLQLNRINLEIAEIEADIRAINAEIANLPDGDPSRMSLISERSFLRLDLLSLRAERARYPRI